MYPKRVRVTARLREKENLDTWSTVGAQEMSLITTDLGNMVHSCAMNLFH